MSSHALLLTTDIGDNIAIKSGFASGYGGSGPNHFSETLELLRRYAADIREILVPPDLIERLDMSLLSAADMDFVLAAKEERPSRWHAYVFEKHTESDRVWDAFAHVLPASLIDPRLRKWALLFWQDPDGVLFKAYRRLEDIVRAKSGIKEHGSKLFSKAFHPESGPLTWKGLDQGERQGRHGLFTSAFMAHRNPRAHREMSENDIRDHLSEFLLLNHLYLLEAEACSSTSRDHPSMSCDAQAP